MHIIECEKCNSKALKIERRLYCDGCEYVDERVINRKEGNVTIVEGESFCELSEEKTTDHGCYLMLCFVCGNYVNQIQITESKE